MKICLINPPLSFKVKKNEEWSNYSLHNFQQLGLGYMAAALIKNGYKEVDIIDCPCQRINNKEAINAVLEGNYDVVGISMFSYNHINAKRIITKLRFYSNDIFIAAGGYIPTLNYVDTLNNNPALNCCFIGEGEKSIINLCNALSSKKNWKEIGGIAYIENGEIKINSIKQVVRNLDELAFPIRLEKNNFSQTLSILTSRGCYGNCSFCSEKSFNTINKTRNMRFRSPQNVVEEICYLIEEYHPSYININDSNFLESTFTRQTWLRQFILLIREKELKVKFRINTRANDILGNMELLEDIIDVGLDSVFIGVESFNQRQLDLYNKKVTVQQNIEAIRLLKTYNVKIEIGFMIFEPFATIDEIMDSLQVLNNLDIIQNLDHNQVFFSSGCKLFSVKGTDIFEAISKNNIVENNELGYRFISGEVGRYYELLERWCEIMLPYNEYKFLIDKSMLFENGKWNNLMNNWFKEIMNFDLLTVIELGLYIEMPENDIKNYFEQKKEALALLNFKYWDVIQALS